MNGAAPFLVSLVLLGSGAPIAGQPWDAAPADGTARQPPDTVVVDGAGRQPRDTVPADGVPRPQRGAGAAHGAAALRENGASAGALRPSDLVWVGVLAGSLMAVEPAEPMEEAIARAVQREGEDLGLDAFASVGEVAGHALAAYGVAAGAFLVGTLADDRLLARVGLRSLESLALASAATVSLKAALGRERPLHSPTDSDEFRFFALSLGRSSFPSGHTAHLFALAGTASRELSDKAGWVPFLAYPVAGLVGVSRVAGRKHWVTDVVSGAAVGILASRVVGRLHEGAEGPVGAIDPLLVAVPDGGVGVGLSITLH